MDNNTAFLLTVVLLIVATWSWPILVEARGLLIAKLRARRERIERKETQ